MIRAVMPNGWGLPAPLWVLLLVLLASGCGRPLPVPQDYAAADELADQVLGNLKSTESLRLVTRIDHSRLAGEKGEALEPSLVTLFSAPELEARLVALDPLVALDLPLRLLAFGTGEEARLIGNDWEYLASRYELADQLALGAAYEAAMSAASFGVPAGRLVDFADDAMQPDGIVTLDSPFGFEKTVDRIEAAIEAQDDTVTFATLDYRSLARGQGVTIRPVTLILFGAPAPGARAMADALTLGLDAFCQKFLVWEDEAGAVHLSFNDLPALARRQDVDISIPLRVTNYRLESVFSEALEP